MLASARAARMLAAASAFSRMYWRCSTARRAASVNAVSRRRMEGLWGDAIDALQALQTRLDLARLEGAQIAFDDLRHLGGFGGRDRPLGDGRDGRRDVGGVVQR